MIRASELFFVRIYSRSGGEWQAARDLFFGPFSEEVVFRGCIVSPIYYFFVSVLDRYHGNVFSAVIRSTFLSPLFFGTAHVHHAYLKLRYERHDVSSVYIQTIFQFAYTYLFGMYATYVYIRIKFASVCPLVVIHCFCNYMGLPDLGILNCAYMKSFKMAIITMHIVGIVLFFYGFSDGNITSLPRTI